MSGVGEKRANGYKSSQDSEGDDCAAVQQVARRSDVRREGESESSQLPGSTRRDPNVLRSQVEVHQLGRVVEEHQSFAEMNLALTQPSHIYDAARGLKSRKRLLLDLLRDVLLREIRKVVAHVRKRTGNAFRNKAHFLGVLRHHLNHLEDVRVTEPTNDAIRGGQTWSAS